MVSALPRMATCLVRQLQMVACLVAFLVAYPAGAYPCQGEASCPEEAYRACLAEVQVASSVVQVEAEVPCREVLPEGLEVDQVGCTLKLKTTHAVEKRDYLESIPGGPGGAPKCVGGACWVY